MVNKNYTVLLLIGLFIMSCSQNEPDLNNDIITSPRDNELSTDYPESKKIMVVGYLPIYQGNTLDWLKKTDLNKLTHIVIAFFNPDSTGEITYGGTEQNLVDAVKYCKDNNIKVLMSIAGGAVPEEPETFYHNILTAGNSSGRTDFVEKLNTFMNKFYFDGVDVDIEGGIMNSTNYSAGYDDFITKLKNKLSAQNKLLTAALGSWNHNNYPDTAVQNFDYVFLMTYDERGSWGWNNGNNSGPIASQSFVENLLTTYQNKGVPKSKLFIGLPFYAYEFNTKADGSHYTSDYSINDLIRKYWKDNSTVAFDDRTGNAYYNGIDSISSKTRYAINNGYAGVMIWELTHDAMGDIKKYSLLSAIHRNNY